MKDIASLFANTRAATEELCAPLQTEDYVPQSAEFTSPPKWHLAHTTWFFEEMILKKYLPNFEEYNPKFGFLFNSYYNSIGERALRTNRGVITRPTVNEVFDYRYHVTKKMKELLSYSESEKVIELTNLGINHEQQHQELLLTDLKYTLSLNPTFPIYSENGNRVDSRNTQQGFVKIPEGIYEIGHQSKDFCFDNEKGRHKVFLHEFEVSHSLVTNQEYLDFIESGGYQDFSYWLDEGWSWVTKNTVTHPLYWQKKDGKWNQFTLSGLQPLLPDSQLCHISFYEANAFAAWKKMRLPTEFEWEAASQLLDWGSRWEWTNSAYLPYPKFQIEEGAVGEYNGKFMVNQMVLRGGSVATANGHSRTTYRNFFHPQYQWQFTGIRLVK